MDQPHSHITRGLALRSDSTPGTFPHSGLPASLAALLKKRLEDRHRKLLKRGDITTAGALAQLATSDAAARLVRELNRRDTLRRYTLVDHYLRPTVDALLWGDMQLRRLLRADPEHAHKLPAYRCAACDENSWRACLVIELLAELAKMTTQPDETRRSEDRETSTRRCERVANR
jgi:hypothetical protein